MSKISTFIDIIDTWPRKNGQTPIQAFAADMSLRYGTAAIMRYRDSIGPAYWELLLRRRQARGLADLDYQTLVRLAAARSHRPRRRRVESA